MVTLGVVIPVFRNEATVLRCLDSLRAASIGTTIEIHIVLDGVVDGSHEIVNTWCAASDLHVRVHEQEHEGIASARNHGLAYVESEWVTFLDADDEMTRARLQSPRRDHPFFGLQALSCPEGVQLPAGTRPGITPYLMSIVAPTALLRAIKGFDPSYTRGDDLDLMIRLQERGYLPKAIPDIFVIRHIHEDNASRDTDAVASDYVSAVRRHLLRRRTASVE